MMLRILFKDGCVEDIPVKVAWQDIHSEYDLYYETYYDEEGKGTFVEMKLIKTWKIIPSWIGGDIKL